MGNKESEGMKYQRLRGNAGFVERQQQREWRRQQVLDYQREQQRCDEMRGATFQPQINRNSRRMLAGRSGDVSYRLQAWGKHRDAKMAHLQEQAMEEQMAKDLENVEESFNGA